MENSTPPVYPVALVFEMTLVQQEALALAITAITTLGLGIFVYLKNPTRRLNQIFGLYSLNIAWWGAWESWADLTGATQPAYYEFAQRMEFVGVFLIPVLFVHFIHELTGCGNRRFIRWGYGISLLLIAMLPTRWMIAGSEPRYYWPRIVIPGQLYYVGFTFFMVMATYGIVCLCQAYQASQGVRRNQLKYLMIGSVIGYLGGTADFASSFGLMIPLLNPYGIYGVAIYAAITTYAIVQHQLIDIQVVVRKSLVYSALVTIMTLGYFMVAFIGERYFQSTLGYRSLALSVILFAGMALAFQPLKRWLQMQVDQWLMPEPKEAMAQRLEILEEEVREADKAKAVGRLAAGVAHEIKNPLSAIQTFMNFLPARHTDPSFIEQFHQVVGRELGRLQELAQGLVDFAKPKAPQREPVDLAAVLDQVVTLTKGDLLDKSIAVETRYQHNGAALMGDAGQLSQVFLNLILNARDAMAKGGRLTVTTRSARDAVEVTIADTGQGIAPADLARLFEPFFTRKAHGSGLGLSIVQRIVQEHGGTVKVDSHLGRGTTFTVRLPCRGEVSA